MGWLVPFERQRFETEREVVLNERRQSYDNGRMRSGELRAVGGDYPADHPYHWPTIGYPSDLRAATVDDARAFFETNTTPRTPR